MSVKKDILVSAIDKPNLEGGSRRVVRMAVVSDGELLDYAWDEPGAAGIAGNIYKGLVTNVFPGTQSCFVNIGQEKNAVLYIKDVAQPSGAYYPRPIETLIRTGQKIVVQALRDASGEKGARVTTKLALPGKFAVLLPDSNQCAVSRRIADQAEADRLRDIALQNMPDGCGLIMRTEAAGANAELIASDVRALHKRLLDMYRNEVSARIPECIHAENDFYRDILFRAFENDVSRVIADDKASYRELLNRASEYNPDITYKLQHYREPWPLFAFYGIQSDVDSLQVRRVRLRSGAYIVIDRTEAMTVVDVNTGKYIGGGNPRETFLRVNTEAAVETARQMRLRDIGGIVVIDALRMNDPADQRAVVGALEAELEKDRQKTVVAGFTRLGLIEMTRKKIRADAPFAEADYDGAPEPDAAEYAPA